MPDEGTPQGVYEAAALAAWNAPGTPLLWQTMDQDAYVALMLARPDFRAMIDAVTLTVTRMVEPPIRADERAKTADVVEAAKAWRETMVGLLDDSDPAEDALAAAVDALPGRDGQDDG